jgi:TonB family protein
MTGCSGLRTERGGHRYADRRRELQRAAWLFVCGIGGVATLAVADNIGAARPAVVPGVVVVARAASGSGPQKDRRVLLAWGAPVAAVRAAGLRCRPAVANDQIPGADLPVVVTCPVVATEGWGVEMPGLTTALQLAPTASSALLFTKDGLVSASFQLDSTAQVISVRQALARLVAAGVSVQVGTDQMPGGRVDDYVVPHVHLTTLEAASRTGGYVEVASEEIPAGPLLVAGESVPRVKPGTQVQPHYPEAARRGHVETTVVLRVTIDERGSVAHIEDVRPQPLGFSRAAEEAVRRWKFTPTLLGGRPVPVLIIIPVPFKLP